MAHQFHGRSNGHATDALKSEVGQLVLVLQGGGALGAYQAGVYHAAHDAGLEPDWIIGTSIGAINAGLIAGNEPQNRLAALQAFWNRVTHKSLWETWPSYAPLTQALSYWSILARGLGSFFEPNPMAFLGPHVQLGSDRAGFYSTEPLMRTLGDLIDVSLLNRGAPRLTVGAACVRTSQMRYFDTRAEVLDIRHIMASGALPPAFPAVRIDGELYWDGGILSNTPTEIVFDDNPRRNSLIFAVHMWNPVGPEPETIWEVMHRQKDIQYSSRVASHIVRQKQTHRLRHIINELAARLPEAERDSEAVREMVSWGCHSRMHVVRLLAPGLAYEDQTKDVDFSAAGIRARWQAGYEHCRQAISRAPWRGDFDPLEGVILHESLDESEAGLAAVARLPENAAPRQTSTAPQAPKAASSTA
jgi:NTE family protein